MAQAFAELEASDETAALTHADWLGLLVDRELTHRRDKRLAARLRYARLRQQASIEDVDYRAPRGLDRALVDATDDPLPRPPRRTRRCRRGAALPPTDAGRCKCTVADSSSNQAVSCPLGRDSAPKERRRDRPRRQSAGDQRL
jgi:IstB-like ATP binding protein